MQSELFTLTTLMATYYAQLADAGLIISESIPVSTQGVGYPCTPGLYTDEQVSSACKHVHSLTALLL